MAKLFFKGIYRLMQLTVWVSFKVYFRHIIFYNKERLREQGPLIVISNHPNTVMDPLVALYKMPAICHLLANYSLFKNPITNFLLTNLFCIPVQRVTDVEEGQPLQNENAFKRANEHLKGGGNLYVAIEGFSFAERRVRTFKTGTARIAFSAELATNFDLNLRILPIAITYSDALKFRKNVIVTIGEPISVDAWRTEYERNPRKVIDTFTDHLEGIMRQMTIDCKDAHEDNFLNKLEMILQEENPQNTGEEYGRSKTVLKNMHDWQARDLVGYEAFKTQVQVYFYKLNRLKINDLNIIKFNFSNLLLLIVALPFALLGFVINAIPAFFSEKMIAWLNIDKAYDTTVRYVSGLVIFPLIWWLELIAIRYFLQDTPWLWLYMPVTTILGLIAWWFYKEGARYIHFFRYKKADKRGDLSDMRNDILTQLMPLCKDINQEIS